MINIIENTLRDGAYVIDFQFTQKHTQDIFKGLDKLGFKYIEVGHGLGLGAWNRSEYGLAAENDISYISAAKSVSKEAKIVCFFIPGIGTEKDILRAIDAGLDFIRIGTNIDTFEKTLPFVRLAKNKGIKVAVNLMKSYAVKPYQFCQIVQKIDKWEMADVVYLVDSAGCMLPNEVGEYIDRTKQKVTTSLGFHGHNNLSLGIANSVQAIKSGAVFIDTCVRGMGRSAGNAQTEILIHILSQMGINTGVDLHRLYDFADNVIFPLMSKKQGLSSEEIHIGVSKFHSSYLPLVEKAIEKYDVDKKKLIKEVSDIDCLNPTQDLFYKIAESMKNE